MPHDIIGHVALDDQVVDAVSGDGSIKGVVNGAGPDVGTSHAGTQVEVDGVATKTKRLAAVAHLCVLNPERIDTARRF